MDVKEHELQEYVHYQHIEVFKDACRKLGLFILIRRTNTESMKFINYPGFVPKPLLCKPKTADNNVIWTVNGKNRQINCAGLVVNPLLVGMAAFKTWEAFTEAKQTWDKYWGGRIPDGFCVQEALESSYFGCVMRCNGGKTPVFSHTHKKIKTREIHNGHAVTVSITRPYINSSFIDKDALQSLPLGCAYIHGDYDLYALVHKDYLNQRNAVTGIFDGQEHIHGKYWEQLVAFANGRMNLDMIQHGSQENFSGHSNEEVDIFAPFPEFDLLHRKTNNAESMKKVFTEMFNNRQTVAG